MNRRRQDEFDLIQLNLQRFDALTNKTSLIERLFSACPILPFTIAFGLGVLLAYKINTSQIIWIIIGAIFPLSLVCLILWDKVKIHYRFALALTEACMIVFSLGAIRVFSITDTPPHHISNHLKSQRQLATLRGKVISPIRTDDLSKELSAIPWLSAQSSFYLLTEQIQCSNGWQKTIGKLRVQISEPINHVHPGNTVQIDCWLSRFTPPANPGQFDLKKYMHERGVYLAASVPIAEGVEVINPSTSFLSRTRSELYRLASDALLDETAINNTVRSLTEALLLGRRGDLSPRIMAAFRDTNLAHFISLSGMHVGILAASFWMVLRVFGPKKRTRAVLCIIMILLYAMVVPARQATMRAVFISCFYFLSIIFRRRTSALNTLSLSALILLFIHPYDLFSAGWQLSYLSVLGILLFYPTTRYHFLIHFYYPITTHFPAWFGFSKKPFQHIVELLALGFSAWIMIAPVLLYYFGQINPLSPLWTVLVLPFVVIILYAGFAKILLSSLLPTLGAILGWTLSHTASAFGSVVVILSKVAALRFCSYRPDFILILIIYMLMITVCVLPAVHWRLRRGAVVMLLLCSLYSGISSHMIRHNRDELEMTCLSVGHGQAIVLSARENEHFLFDAGSNTNRNLARKTILPFLQSRGIFSLDAVYLSHGDMDHINALVDISDAVSIKSIYANQILLESAQTPSIEKDVCQALFQSGQAVKPFQPYRGISNIMVYSAWPKNTVLHDDRLSENDRSEVLLIEYAGRKILLCGDIERTAQQQLLDYHPNLHVDILVLPHHGSTTNLDVCFIESLNPSVVIASCSKKSVENAYQPSSESSIQAFYTGRDGAVSVTIKPDGSFNADSYLRPDKNY